MIGTGYFPAARDQAYITQDGSALVGTSEVPLASFYSDEIVELERRIKLCALSTCFRREAGAAGKDTACLYRVHQFDKVEQVVIHGADETEQDCTTARHASVLTMCRCRTVLGPHLARSRHSPFRGEMCGTFSC
jgi:seryl-tRNA synthetase